MLAVPLAALLALGASAGPLPVLSAARPAGALHATPQHAWGGALDRTLAGLSTRWGDVALAPVLRQLELQGVTPQVYGELPLAPRAALAEQAARAVAAEAASESALLVGRLRTADPASPQYEVLAAQAAWLAGPLSGFVPAERREALASAAAQAKAQLGEAKARRLEAAIAAVALNLGQSALEATPPEAAAAALENPGSRLMTPGVARLRAAGGRLSLAVPSPTDSAVFKAKVGVLKARVAAKRFLARSLYRPLLGAFRRGMEHAGELWRKYVSGQPQAKHDFRWGVIERLHKDGDFRGSFGHPVYGGQAEVMSGVIFRQEALEKLKGAQRRLGPAVLSPTLGISGMSYPQLSAESHLSLLYVHLRLAKEQGLRQLYNTGEGGPGLLLGLLQRDPAAVKSWIIAWNVANGQFAAGGWREAAVVQQVDSLMAQRDALLAEFSEEDLAKAQVVAQYGSALNGARGGDGRVDFDKLRRTAADPHVVMTQFKLKQAAKRGAKVDPKKVDDLVAAFREIPRGRPFKSPEIAPDLASYEEVAALIRATRLVTGKPVSLKFGVGDAADLLAFLQALRDLHALPEHIQLDGRGDDFSPGSGNAPPMANTSLPAREAVIVADAVLKKLGVRERVLLEATGDILQPVDGVEALALGADLIAAGRGWMGMALGCAKVKACAEGTCPYGIASKSNSMVGLSLDAAKVAPKGYLAAANWHKSYVQTLAEAGLDDWTRGRHALGLDSGSARIRIKDGPKTVPLDRFYDPRYVADLLRGALTAREVRWHVFGR